MTIAGLMRLAMLVIVAALSIYFLHDIQHFVQTSALPFLLLQ